MQRSPQRSSATTKVVKFAMQFRNNALSQWFSPGGHRTLSWGPREIRQKNSLIWTFLDMEIRKKTFDLR